MSGWSRPAEMEAGQGRGEHSMVIEQCVGHSLDGTHRHTLHQSFPMHKRLLSTKTYIYIFLMLVDDPSSQPNQTTGRYFEKQ